MSLAEYYEAVVAGSSCICSCHDDGDICLSCVAVWCEACRYLEGVGV